MVFMLEILIPCIVICCCSMSCLCDTIIENTIVTGYSRSENINTPEQSVDQPIDREDIEIVLLDRDRLSEFEHKYKTESCPICLCEFEEKEYVSVTNCYPKNHLFHANCLSEWLMRGNYCPMCNNNLVTNLVEPAQPPPPYHQDDETQVYSDDEVFL